MKKIITVSIVLLIGFILFWIGTAYWSVYQIKQAIDNNQPEKIEKYINFPRVQESLKNQIEKRIAQEMGFTEDSSHFVLGKKLNNLISSQLVKTIVTPEMVSLFFQGKVLHENYPKNINKLIEPIFLVTETEDNSVASASVKNIANEETKLPSSKFLSWNQFVVMIPIDKERTTQIFLEPESWKWKIVDIQLSK